MLKLMKFEMIHSVRTFATSFVVFLFGCVLMPFAIHFLVGNQTSEFLLGILGFVFTILVMGIMIALFVSVFINFKRSMFERPGYLTLTLPKSSLEVLCSKLIIAIVWIFIGTVVLCGGFLLMMLIISILEGNFSNISDVFKILDIILKNINIDVPYILVNILLFISELSLVVSSIYLALSIVHTKWIRKYKIVIAILIFFILNAIINVNVISSLFGFYQITTDIWALIFYIVSGAILVMLSTYILDNHIEIE